MADGQICAHCGFQESDHLYPERFEVVHIRGYRMSIYTCDGFQQRVEDMDEYNLTDHEMECLEKRAEAAAAWGTYAATRREERFNSLSPKQKQNAQNQQCLVIGGGC